MQATATAILDRHLAAVRSRFALCGVVRMLPLWLLLGSVAMLALLIAGVGSAFSAIGGISLCVAGLAGEWWGTCRTLRSRAASLTMVCRIDKSICAADALSTLYTTTDRTPLRHAIENAWSTRLENIDLRNVMPKAPWRSVAMSAIVLAACLYAISLAPHVKELLRDTGSALSSGRAEKSPSTRGGVANSADVSNNVSAGSKRARFDSAQQGDSANGYDNQPSSPSVSNKKGAPQENEVDSPWLLPRLPQSPSESGGMTEGNTVQPPTSRPKAGSSINPPSKAALEQDELPLPAPKPYREREIRILPLSGQGDLKRVAVVRDAIDPHGENRLERPPFSDATASEQTWPDTVKNEYAAGTSTLEREWLKQLLEKISSSD